MGRWWHGKSLSPSERDQVYLSLCLALLVAIARRGAAFPLLLDEPFTRLDAQATAALAAVLDDLGRQGQQIVVFTGQREAADRMASLGAPVREISDLRLHEREPSVATVGNVARESDVDSARGEEEDENSARRVRERQATEIAAC